MTESADGRVHIRRMTPQDIPAVVSIERICFTDPWTEAAYQATLLLPYAHYFVAETCKKDSAAGREDGARKFDHSMESASSQAKDIADSHIVGMIGLELISGDAEISNVAVLPAYRRKGIAHALMEAVLLDGEENQIQNFTLEVREGNTAARALYESFGFVTEGVRRDYYDTPTENALIMWRR